ncbi:hypothetical protein D3C73_1531450 [compost metagenome]
MDKPIAQLNQVVQDVRQVRAAKGAFGFLLPAGEEGVRHRGFAVILARGPQPVGKAGPGSGCEPEPQVIALLAGGILSSSREHQACRSGEERIKPAP